VLNRSNLVLLPDPFIQQMLDQVTTAQVMLPAPVDRRSGLVDVPGTPSQRYTYGGGNPQNHRFVGQHGRFGAGGGIHQWAGPDYPNVIGEMAVCSSQKISTSSAGIWMMYKHARRR
jgi:hypothetical protein